MNGKAFPMFPQWQILFGKDRATGEMAEGPAEIRDDGSEEEIEQAIHDESFVGTNDCYTPRFANGDFVFGGGSFIDLSRGGSPAANPNTPTSNQCQCHHSQCFHCKSPPAKKVKKMSKAEAKQAALNDAFGSYMAESKEVMVKLVDAIGFEQRLSDRRGGVVCQLEKLNLDVDDMLTANAMTLASDKKVDDFYSVPE
ncbi:hypothetical protein Vadar_020840 [Vaccinium darrowii]|uniref:Uncharacterized protein n=1 Tax=Vaccinium darrowii TaxID=229202 RepID=A0ACB7ZLX1_9ERIC|nr:hypothetical protein Vadar_020840 [Vaccinium darrowii]